MWQLYQFPLCPFSRKVRLLLGEKGIGYELVRESPWDRRDEFMDMNPAGETPVMVDASRPGAPLIDSMAICEYFEETVDKAATINGTAAGGDVVATLTGHARRYGRWETRVRAEQYSSGHTPYRVIAELVPTRGGYHCGARNIVLETYKLGTRRANMAVRTLPNNQFTYGKRLNLKPGPFHTYAVEVTKSHVSWFVDAHVVTGVPGGLPQKPRP